MKDVTFGLPKPKGLPFLLSVFDGSSLADDSTLYGHPFLLWPLTLHLLHVMASLVLGSFPYFLLSPASFFLSLPSLPGMLFISGAATVGLVDSVQISMSVTG